MNVSEDELETIYQQWKPKIQGLSRKRFIQGYEHEDLESELKIVLIKCVYAYDGTRASFHTFLHRCMLNWLSTLFYRTKNRVPPDKSISIDVAFNVQCDDALDAVEFYDRIRQSSLSEHSRMLIAAIVTGSVNFSRKGEYDIEKLEKLGIPRKEFGRLKREIKSFLTN